MTKHSAPERLYKVKPPSQPRLSTARLAFEHLGHSMGQPSSALRRSRERQDFFGNAALPPELQQKPLGSRAEQRDRFAMNGKKWATLYSVVTKLPAHILIAAVCIPNSASFNSLVVDPHTGLDEISRVSKKFG